LQDLMKIFNLQLCIFLFSHLYWFSILSFHEYNMKKCYITDMSRYWYHKALCLMWPQLQLERHQKSWCRSSDHGHMYIFFWKPWMWLTRSCFLIILRTSWFPYSWSKTVQTKRISAAESTSFRRLWFFSQ